MGEEIKSFSPGRWTAPCWAAVYLFIAGVIQFYFVSVPWDEDTAYHVAVRHLIQLHGILHTFPWTPFSWLSNHYADKELLFHLLFVPLANLSWILAAKIVGMFLEAVMLFAIYFVLRQEKVRFAGLWALLPLITADISVFRFSLVRPQPMSITLALLFLWAVSRGRFVLLAVVSAIYPWSYLLVRAIGGRVKTAVNSEDPLRLLSVIIPARDEEGCICSTVEHLHVELRLHGIPHEIKIIDDGSTDRTWELMQDLKQRITELQPIRNTGANGFGRAVSFGLDRMTEDAVVVMMGDESDDCRDVVRYWQELQNGYDCVFGSRFMKGGGVIDYPPH